MQESFIPTNSVHGWGVDADKSVRPNYPMWKKSAQGTGAHWTEPEQQLGFNDFHSLERPGPTKVFGKTVAPSGLSGKIRKLAFSYGEGSFAHWMTLILADRINVVEGLIDDVTHGVMPGLLKERGWNVDKQFKTKRYKRVVNLSIMAALLPIVYFVFLKKKNPSNL
jgi:hypothetical protein